MLITENQVSVLIKEYFRTDNRMIQIGDPIARRYPLQRVILGYEHNLSQGYSYPVQKLYVHIDDIEYANQQGDIVLDDEYIDEKSKIKHQERVVNKYEMDDKHLQARQLSEIFITTENGEEVIDEAKVREGNKPISYVRTSKPIEVRKIGDPEARESDEEFNYQRTETSEEYMRPDGTPFVKKTEDWERVAKPKPPAPVQPAIQYIDVPVYHRKGGNLFHRARWSFAGSERVRADSGIGAGYGHHGERYATGGGCPWD